MNHIVILYVENACLQSREIEMNKKELLNIISDKTVIVIFGANDIGRFLYRLIKESYDGTIIVCDSSRKKIGTIDEIKVIPFDEAIRKYKNAFFLITSYLHYNEMRQQLLDSGISEEKIEKGFIDEALIAYIEERKKLKEKPLEKIQFEVDVTEHCNLNCKCCSQFSCITEPSFIDINEMKKDFIRMGELFNGVAKRIYLIGGEPLLNKEIVSCMKIARNNFPVSDISVFTNGVLLHECDEAFWEECRNDSISIIVTKYPIDIDYYSIKKMIESKGIKFQFFGYSEDFKTMTNLGLDLEGKQNIEESFYLCGESNNCIKLKHGKLYTCTRPAAIPKFNKFFHQNLEVNPDDYIDIYKETSGKEILEKLTRPIPFCRYCNQKIDGKSTFKWGTTNKDIKEFVMLK